VGADDRFQFLPNAAFDDAQIIFLPIAYDDTVCGRRGTADAPRAIFAASEQLEYYEEDLGWSPFLHLRPHVRPELRRAEGETEPAFHTRIEAEARAIGEGGGLRFPVALGGEHSVTPSVLAGCLSAPATIVILDAHADLRPAYKGSGFNHACTMHRLREAGHRLIIIGLRSLADLEAARLADDAGIAVHWARDLQDRAGRAPMLAALGEIRGDVWLSVDMDAFDPAAVPGVGTPQPGGLAWCAAAEILRALFENASANMRGMDVVELIPEAGQLSQLTAAKLAQKAISHWGRRHRFDEAPRIGAQAGIAYE
jgi:agmatinase